MPDIWNRIGRVIYEISAATQGAALFLKLLPT
jgi:hypothetical protein